MSINNKYPNAIAAAIATPKAADFPRPRAAVRDTVLLKVFSVILSMKVRIAFAYLCTATNKFIEGAKKKQKEIYLVNGFRNSNKLAHRVSVFERDFQFS